MIRMDRGRLCALVAGAIMVLGGVVGQTGVASAQPMLSGPAGPRIGPNLHNFELKSHEYAISVLVIGHKSAPTVRVVLYGAMQGTGFGSHPRETVIATAVQVGMPSHDGLNLIYHFRATSVRSGNIGVTATSPGADLFYGGEARSVSAASAPVLSYSLWEGKIK